MTIKLLCIDDEPEYAELIAEEFDERGFDVSLARDGVEGIEAMLRLEPDIVLCDIMMPTSGFEVLQGLLDRRLDLRSRMLFIFVSACDDPGMKRRARRLGADDYVVKPIDFERLAASVMSRLSRAHALRGVAPGPVAARPPTLS